MKAVLNRNIKIIIIIAAIASIVVIKANAQAPAPPSGAPGTNGSGIYANGNPVGGTAPTVPFDGGMSLMLLASGVGYAAGRMRVKKNLVGIN